MPRRDLIQFYKGTAARWALVNPTLEWGEPGYETDTGLMKIGNQAEDHWNDLLYWDPSVGGSPVVTVNGQTGVVVLDFSDVGADAAGTAASVVAAEAILRVAGDAASVATAASDATTKANAAQAAAIAAAAVTSAAQVGVETARAVAAEAVLSGLVDDEETRALTAEGVLNGLISAEAARAIAVEAVKADLVSGKVPTSQIPNIALVGRVVVANQAAMLALTTSQVQPGDLAVRQDGAGTFLLTDTDPSILANWQHLDDTLDAVLSVNGQAGTVVLGFADVGADAAGAAATAQAAAIAAAAADATTKANNAKSGAEATAAGALASHEADTTNIHGITNTALLETLAGAQAKADAALAAALASAANGSNITSGTVADARIASTIARDSEVTAAVAAEAALARNADNLTSGLVAQPRLGSGSGGTGLKFLADDQVYRVPAGGGSGVVVTIVPGNNIDVDDTDPANVVVSVETLTLADVGVSASAAEVDILDGALLSTAELNFVDGVTSAIQAQLDGKASTGSVTTVAGDLAAHLADTTDAHAASAITNTPAGTVAATTVQGAINELDSEKATTGSVSTVAGDLAAHLADTSAAHAASAVSFAPASGIAATDVQAALVELVADVAAAYQPLDADLTLLGGLNQTTDRIIQSVAGAWASRTPSQVKVTLGLVASDLSDFNSATDSRISLAISALDVMVFKGVIDCSANPNYPAADKGDTYRVSVAGKIGGGAGINVQVGDTLLCLTDGSSAGTHGAVGANWNISQANIDGAVIGPSGGVTDGHFAQFDTTSGVLIKGGLAPDTDGTLAANSATRIPTQSAVKTYADTKQTGTASLTTLSGLAQTTDNIIMSVGSAWASRTPAQVKTALAITAADLTNFNTTADARIAAAVGVSVQAFDSDLSTIAGLSATTDNMIQSVAGAWASRTPAQVKTALAITAADLTNFNTAADARIAAAVGVTVQAFDADLNTIAGLTATTNNFLVSVASAWASRTPAQVKVTLGLDAVDNISDAGKPVSTAQQTALDLKRNIAQTIINDTTTAHSVTSTMSFNLITRTHASASTETIDGTGGSMIPIGASVDVVNLGAGAVTLTPGTGTPTITSSGAGLKLLTGKSASVIRIASNQYYAVGGLSA